jgi:hypothetical protein
MAPDMRRGAFRSDDHRDFVQFDDASTGRLWRFSSIGRIKEKAIRANPQDCRHIYLSSLPSAAICALALSRKRCGFVAAAQAHGAKRGFTGKRILVTRGCAATFIICG